MKKKSYLGLIVLYGTIPKGILSIISLVASAHQFLSYWRMDATVINRKKDKES